VITPPSAQYIDSDSHLPNLKVCILFRFHHRQTKRHLLATDSSPVRKKRPVTENLFDDTNHCFHGGFSFSINVSALPALSAPFHDFKRGGVFGAPKACPKRSCKGLLWDWRFSGIKGLAVMVAH
jgi:hypothetical protein